MVFSLIREMEWKNFYIDLVLVPLAVLTLVLYHVFLWYKAKTSPHNTVIGVNSVGRRIWVESMMEVRFLAWYFRKLYIHGYGFMQICGNGYWKSLVVYLGWRWFKDLMYVCFKHKLRVKLTYLIGSLV